MVATYHPAMSEAELIGRAKNRDHEAFAILYQRHAQEVLRHILYIVKNRHLAEELVSETFLQAWRAIHRFEYRGLSILLWLKTIGHNLAVRHCQRRRETECIDDLRDYLTDRKAGPDEVVEIHSETEAVRTAILKLPETQSQVIVLRFVKEMDYPEVAEIMGKSIPAIRLLQHRGLRKLREILES